VRSADPKADHGGQVAADKNRARGLGFGGVARDAQCGNAVHVTVIPYDDYRVPATWEVASCDAGTSSPEECERALCDIVGRLQQHFDIAP
jgi:hypothetical protein